MGMGVGLSSFIRRCHRALRIKQHKKTRRFKAIGFH